MTSFSLHRVGLAASVAGLMVVTAEAASAAPPTPTSACPGEVSIGPTGDMIPAPAGMPLNCTQAFYDGTANFAGRVTGYAYDPYTTTTTIYDQTGGVVGATNSLGETIIIGPEHGVLSTLTDPSGHTTTFTYDPAGSVAQVIAPMSSTTSYTYDSDQRATQVTDPLGGVTTNAYDSEGRMMTSTDAAGVTTTNTYDSSTGRLTAQTETQGGMTIDTITYMYDPSGQLMEVSDSHGNVTTYTYNPMGQVASETVDGVTTMYTYDPSGDVASMSVSGGPTTTYMYDPDNQLIKATETNGGVTDITMYSYDPDGNLIQVTDPEGEITKFTYDAYGDVISMIDPNGGTTSFAYFAVPEPSTWGTMLLGFAGLAFAGYRRAKRAAVVSV
jgi:YD repeat-containing protein